MTYAFHPEAETEFLAAIDYYEECDPGLGGDFAGEVYATVANIVAHPQAWPVLRGETRRCLTNRFPYGIIYSIEPDRIYILAVMHLHRHPDYWIERK